jgi:hypothetical protein
VWLILKRKQQPPNEISTKEEFSDGYATRNKLPARHRIPPLYYQLLSISSLSFVPFSFFFCFISSRVNVSTLRPRPTIGRVMHTVLTHASSMQTTAY